MKVLITQEKLNKALSHVSRVSSSKNTLPILSNILMRTKNNRLELISTNLEIAITETVVGKVEQEGEITIPARILSDFVGSLSSSETIQIEKEGNKINIKSGKYKASINGTPTEEFPNLPKVDGQKIINISAQTLKKGLSQTIFAASKNESRQILTGVLFHLDGKNTFIAATDSYRLAEKQLTETDTELKVVLPATALNEVLRIIDDGDENILIKFDETQAQFSYLDSEIITRVIDGQYPAYKQLIPKKSETVVKILKKEFIEITKVASLFARESAGGIKIEASEQDQEIKINSIAAQIGENTSTAKADISGSGEVTLNSRYVLDALNALDGEEITFRFSGKLSPCVFESISKDVDYQHIVMPLKS